MTRLCRPEPSKSAASTPIPARATPASLKATPAVMPMSSNVPSRLLRYRRFGCVSFATNTSRHPSSSPSRSENQSPLHLGSQRVDFHVTSSYVPSPRSWSRDGGSTLHDAGVQYDFDLPSSEQKRSVACDHST